MTVGEHIEKTLVDLNKAHSPWFVAYILSEALKRQVGLTETTSFVRIDGKFFHEFDYLNAREEQHNLEFDARLKRLGLKIEKLGLFEEQNNSEKSGEAVDSPKPIG